MRLQFSTWPEIERYLQRSSGVIVPTGSAEQHGPSGLIGTDALCAEAIAQGTEREKLSALRAAGAHLTEFSAATRHTIVEAMLRGAENANESVDVRDLAVRVLTIAYYDLPQDDREQVESSLRALSQTYRPPALVEFLAHL